MKKSFLFALTLLLCSMQVSAYTFYFHPGSWAGTYAKYAVLSWSTDYDAAVYGEFMTPVDEHDGWFSTSVPDGNSNLYIAAYNSDATDPAVGVKNWSEQLSNADTYTYYYNIVGYMEDFDCKLTNGRILSGNILYNVNDENLTAEVDYDQSPVAPTGELIIPSSFTWKTTTYTVTSIASSAYWYAGGVTSVSLPNTLLHIGDAAFIGTGLTSVTIPSSVTSIEDGAFALCGNLSSVTLEEGLTALGTQMFQGDPSLTQISFPNSITDLPAGILSSCENLVSVTLGEGVDTIEHNAFDGSNSLARLTIYAPAPPKVNLEYNPALVKTCSLMVPSSAKAAYEAHPYWKNFDIKGIYIVTFKDFSGNTIKTEAVEEGKSATAPDAPAVGCHTFTGWDEAFNNVTSDLVVTAQYSLNQYEVKFLGWEEKELKKQTVNCGGDAEAPEAPEVAGHTFSHWDKAFTDIRANLTVNAVYTINTYTVKFYGWDDELLDTQIVDWNTAAEAPADPEHTGYDFKGWNPANFSSVTENMDIHAQFEIKHFSVVFKNGDVILKDTIVDWNTAAIAPADPTREGHTFTGWSPAEFSNVTSDMVIIAQFAINKYTVRFFGWDNELLNTQTVDWNTAAEAPAEPSHEGYDFKGWDTDFSSVKSDLDVKAKFEIKHFTVVFKDWDGTILKAEQEVNWNEAAIAPENPHRNYYTFVGWDKAFDHVQADLVITAQYEPGEDADITVQFLDPTKTDPELAHTDVVIRIPAAPEIEGFTFLYWQPVAERIDGVIKIQAIYAANEPTSAPDVYANPKNPAQKLIRDGKVYILTDDRTYTISGQLVK